MADHDDEATNLVESRARLTYFTLHAACADLPVPIALPGGEGLELVCREAVQHAARIMDQLPLDTESKRLLLDACLYWLAGVDVFTLHLESPASYRLMAAEQLFADAEELLDRMRDA